MNERMEDIKKDINKARKRLMIASDQLSGIDGCEKDMQFIDEIIKKLEKRFDL